jgi:hypothetical protein
MPTFEDLYLFKAFLVLFSLLLFGLIATLPLYWLAFIERSVYLENIALENEERKKESLPIIEKESTTTFFGQLQRRRSGQLNFLSTN